MWLNKSQQRGEWLESGEHKTNIKGDQGTEAFWNIICVYFLLNAMRSQTVKVVQVLLIEYIGRDYWKT